MTALRVYLAAVDQRKEDGDRSAFPEGMLFREFLNRYTFRKRRGNAPNKSLKNGPAREVSEVVFVNGLRYDVVPRAAEEYLPLFV